MIPKETDNGTKLIINDNKIEMAIINTKMLLDKTKQDILIATVKRDLLYELISNLEKIESENT